MNLQDFSKQISELRIEVSRIFVGQENLVEGVLASLFGGGHVLIEGVPGLGKTLLVRTLGRILGLHFSRIQFTPDLMPADITGTHIYNEKEAKFHFHPGPVFTNLLLADEINRSPAKTHSALLEIMQELQVTTDNQKFLIPGPFLVMATQNPVESEGTYNLPEAQLDRFLLKLQIDYPTEEDEKKILKLHADNLEINPETTLRQIFTREIILEMQKLAAGVKVSDIVISYINQLVRATRKKSEVYLGASPRAGIAILKTSRAIALMEGRDYVIPDDVQAVALPALRHRVMLTPEAEVEGRSPDNVIKEIIEATEVPKRVA